jgi:hypothetical protein
MYPPWNGSGATSHELTNTKIARFAIRGKCSLLNTDLLRTPVKLNGASRATDDHKIVAMSLIIVIRLYSASWVGGGSFTTTTDAP